MNHAPDGSTGWGKRTLRGSVGAPAIGAVAGLLAALSVPPFGWWPLAWLGIAVLSLGLTGRGWRGRAAIGATFGLVDYGIGLFWVQEFSMPGYAGVVLVSLLYTLVSVVAVPGGRRRYVVIGLPCAFVLADWLRDRYPLGGLPLGGISLGQSLSPLVPSTRLGGSLALTGETVLVGVILGEALRYAWGWWRGRSDGLWRLPATASVWWGLVVVVVVAVAVPVAGLLSPSGAGGGFPSLSVALVQGGGNRGTRAINTNPQLVFDRELDASAGLRSPIDLVVWPEGTLTVFKPVEETKEAAQIAGLAERLNATVLVGVDQNVSATRYYNEVLAWGPKGKVVGSYVKNHLVPFGEYVPFRSFISRYFNVDDVPYDAIAGHSSGLLRTPAGPLAMMISYEVFFDSRARSGVNAGGELLVVPTDTASYRATQVPTQEVAADRLRAWETGRWLVQATPTGYTNVISPTGAVERTTRLDEQAVVLAEIPLRNGKTVFDAIGDWPVLGLAGAIWALTVAAAWRRRRRMGVEPERDDSANLPVPAA